MAANPGTFTEPDLVDRSQQMLAQRYLKDPNGVVGTQTLERWTSYSGWVYANGGLVGPDGKPVTQKPDFSTWFTDDYLAQP